MGEILNKKTCILLVDDDEDLLVLMRFRLKAEGFEVMISPNAENISSMVAKHPDIIFLDIHMNGVDGGVICKKLKSSPDTADIPIIMFSANDDIESIADSCGADGFMSKPFDPTELRSEVSRVLHN